MKFYERKNPSMSNSLFLPTTPVLRTARSVVVAFVLLSLFGQVFPAQASSLVVGVQDRRLDIAASFAEDDVVNDQTSLRATYTWNMGDALTLVAAGGAASSYLGLNDTRIEGPTDLRVRGLIHPGDHWVFGVGSVVPLGLYELTANEVTTAQWVWNPRSGFPLTRLGEGLGWEATIARAFEISGNTSLGIAAAFLRHGEFDLIEGGTASYRLGDSRSASAAIDWRLPGNGSALLDVSFANFGSDELSGAEYLSKGNQFGMGFGLSLPMGGFVTRANLDMTYQFDNELTAAAAADTIAISESGGSRVGLSGRIGHSLGRSVLLYVDGQFAMLTGSDYAIPINGTSTAIGPGFGWRAHDSFSLGAHLAFLSSTGDDDLDFTGTDVLVTLEFRPGGGQ